MNQQEFNQWWTDFKIRFPDLGGLWFAEGRSESHQRVVLSGFAEVLGDVQLAEALAANRGLQRGDIQPGFTGKWDRDEIARKVRVAALNARAPNTWTGPNDDPFPQPKREDSQIGGALHELIEMQEKGASRDECDAFLRKRFPARPDRERRYTCIECLDGGRVDVWHWERVYIAKRDGIEAALKSQYTVASVACSCRLGDAFVQRKIPLVRFDERKHCQAPGGDVSSAKAVAAFQEWLATCDDVSKRANYEPAFADQGEF